MQIQTSWFNGEVVMYALIVANYINHITTEIHLNGVNKAGVKTVVLSLLREAEK